MSELNRALILLIASLAMVSCNVENGGSVRGDGNGGLSLGFAPPGRILQSRGVITEALSVTVAANGRKVQLTRGDDNQWFGTIMVPSDAEFDVTVTWSESVEGGLLILAQASKSVSVEAGALASDVTFRSDEFNTGFDDDNDGRTNLEERVDGTGPFDDTDSLGPGIEVTLDMQVALPDVLSAASGDVLESLSAQLNVVNGSETRDVALSREDKLWLGATTATENSDTLFVVEFFYTANTTIRLAKKQQSIAVGSGGTTVIDGSNYDIDFDDDNDGLSNSVEIRDGSNPRDSNSPLRDPCEPSQFGQGCTNDFDLDGKPDSQETEEADADEDGVPDYQESSITDLDLDGLAQELDVNDQDPCIPSESNDACQNPGDDDDGDDGDDDDDDTDTDPDFDNDGETDVEEGNGDQDDDGIPDREESDEVDSDSDGFSDEADIENDNPCAPRTNNAACQSQAVDTDMDGESDMEEGSGDQDGDGTPDYLESDELDDDLDLFPNEADLDNANPCIPNTQSEACLALNP